MSTKWKPGKSGNAGGRPKGALNKISESKQFKKTLLGVSKEALENIIDLMRSNKVLAEQLLQNAEDLDEAISDAETEGNTDLAKQLKAEKLQLQERGVSAKEGAAKYAIKLVDYTYHITVHNDNLEIKRYKADIKDNEETDKDSNEDFEEDDGMPLVSIVPLK